MLYITESCLISTKRIPLGALRFEVFMPGFAPSVPRMKTNAESNLARPALYSYNDTLSNILSEESALPNPEIRPTLGYTMRDPVCESYTISYTARSYATPLKYHLLVSHMTNDSSLYPD